MESFDNFILPVNEWFPATSRFIRSSISRIRQRSPSPHLDLDEVEVHVESFNDERRLAEQRIRLADLEPKRNDLIQFNVKNDCLELGSLYKETKDFEQRKFLLEESMESVSNLTNYLSICKSLFKEINYIFQDSVADDDEKFKMKEFIDDDLILGVNEIITRFDCNIFSIEDNLKYPLNVQLDDVYCLTLGLNERIVSLKTYDSALSEKQLSCKQLSEIQKESIRAMDRAQNSLFNLTSSSLVFDRKIASKNAEIEKKIKKVEESSKDFDFINKIVSKQLDSWQIISDTFLLNKLKNIS